MAEAPKKDGEEKEAEIAKPTTKQVGGQSKSLDIRLAPVENSDQTLVANYCAINVSPGMAFLDFAFLGLGMLAALPRVIFPAVRQKLNFGHFLFGLVLATVVSSFASVVHAQDGWDFAAPHKARCSVGTMLDMTRCLEKELRDVEERLNSEYQSLLRSLEDPELLKQAQRAWLHFRKVDCDYAASGIDRSGSLYPYAQMACKINLDEKRIRDLRSYASGDGAGAPRRK